MDKLWTWLIPDKSPLKSVTFWGVILTVLIEALAQQGVLNADIARYLGPALVALGIRKAAVSP